MESATTSLLRQHGVKPTAQRLAVLRAVSQRPHETADAITHEVQLDVGAISRQAVYDALSLLASKGLIRRIQPVGSPARYEDRVADNHHHVICRLCGDVADVDCAVGATPCLTASNDQGFEIDEADVVYWGRCPQCQRAGLEVSPFDLPTVRSWRQRHSTAKHLTNNPLDTSDVAVGPVGLNNQEGEV